MREAQREANEEAKAEYNPAAYGMNRAEEQLLGYASTGAVVAQPVTPAVAAANTSVVVTPDTRRLSPSQR